MFKLGKSAPVVPPRPALTHPAGPTAANNTAQPRPLNFAPLRAGEQGLECLPMEAWHESALAQQAPESRGMVTRLAASIRALVRPLREAAPATHAIPTANHPQESRLAAQPAPIAAHIARFLGDGDLHALSQTARQFETIPASNPRFAARAPLARQLEQIELRAADMTNESKRLRTKLDLLNDLKSPDASRAIRASRLLDPDDCRSDIPRIRARISEIDAAMPELRLKRYEIRRDMQAAGATAQPAPETKAATETSSSSSTTNSSSSQAMPMPPDQWEARQNRE